MLRSFTATVRRTLPVLFALGFVTVGAHAAAPGTLSFVPSGAQGSAVNMGAVNVGATGAAMATQTLTFTANGGSVTFGTTGKSGTSGSSAVSVLTMGAPNLDLTLSATNCSGTLTSGSSCTVTVNFSPKYAGARNGAVTLVDNSGNILATVLVYGVGNGPQAVFNPGKSSSFSAGSQPPQGIAVDGSGNVYVASPNTSTIIEFPYGCTATSCSKTLGGGLSGLTSVALDGAGNLYVTSFSGSSVKEIPAGCASSGCVSALGGGLTTASNVAVDGGGNLYVADADNNVKEIPAGCTSSSCVKSLPGSGFFPFGVAVDGSGNVYFSDAHSNTLLEIPAGCSTASCITAPLGGGFSNVQGIAVDGGGSVYITDAQTLKAVPPGCTSSSCVITLAPSLASSIGVAVDGSGNVYVVPGNQGVTILDRADAPSYTFPTTTNGGSTDTTDGPYAVTLANIGNAALSFPAPTAAGAQNPSLSPGFSLTGTGSASACPLLTSSSTSAGSLPAGATCTAQVNFTPGGTASGTVGGQLIFSDTNLNAAAATPAMQKVNLTGMATATVTKIAFGTSPTTPLSAGSGAGTVTVVEEASDGTTVTGASDVITLTVTYPDATTQTYTSTASSGIASFSLGTPALDEAGSYSYTASLTGATSVLATEAVVADTNVKVTSSQSPVLILTQVTYTATVAASAPGIGTPTGTVTFSAPGQTSQTKTLSNGSAQASFTFLTGANTTVTATYNGATYFNGSNNSTTQIVQQPYSFLVTTLNDDATGAAGNCVAGASGTGGGNASCSLRDAIAAANAVGAANTSSGTVISFLPSLTTAGPQSINLATNGTLVLSQSATINGPGANLLTLAGGGVQIMQVTGGMATISNLTFDHGATTTSEGGAIYAPNVSLTLTSDVFSNNSSADSAGAVFFDSATGTLNVTNSTFTANTAATNGGAIESTAGNVTVSNSTFSGNQATTAVTSAGGALYATGGTLAITNSTFSTNSASLGAAVDSGSTAITASNSIFANNTPTVSGTVLSTGGSVASKNNDFYNNLNATNTESDCVNCTTTAAVTGNPNLAALGNYGGPVTTMVPLAPSAAICAGTVALSGTPGAANNQGVPDARGALHSTAYCSTSQVDLGAAQTSYAISFTQEPPSTVPASTTISPGPSVTVTEDGLDIGGASVGIAVATGTLTGTTPQTTGANGLATFGDLQLTGVVPNDTLVASLALNTGVTGSPLLATSTTFGSLLITPTTLTAGQVGVTYSQPLSTANGNGPYTYTIANTGTDTGLPKGLALAANGTVSGTPQAGGTFTFTVKSTDTNNAYATQDITLVIAPPTIVFTPMTLPTFTVGTAPTLSITASGGTANYTYSYANNTTLPAGLILNTSTGQVTGTPTTKGPYSVTIVATDSSSGTGPYSASVTYSGTVLPGQAKVVITGLSQVYNNNMPLPVTVTTTPAGLSYSVLYGAVNTTPTSTTVPSKIGQYSVSATITDPNWVGSDLETETIALAPATVTFGNLNFTYTGSPISTTATAMANGQNLTVVITYNGSTTPPTAAGSYTVVGTINDPQYAGSTTSTMVIAKAPLTITAPSPSSVYGAPLPSLTGSYTGALGSDSFVVTGSVPTNGTTLGVGHYTVTPTATGPAVGNYNITPVTGTLTITAATLTIKGPNVSVVYGASQLPSLAGTYSGAVGSDTFTIGGSTSATPQSNVVAGGYTITPSVTSGNTSNYVLSIVPGVLTITPATLTITGPTISKVYGAAVPTSLTGSYSGNVGSDTFTVTGTTSATAFSPVVAGGYPIMPMVAAGSGTNLSNYIVKPVNGTLNVTPAALTITGANATIVYGSAVPPLTGTYNGAVGTDTFTVGGTISGNPAVLTAGSYTVIPTVMGANLSSYTVTPVNGSLTVTKATLTITGPTTSKVYGTANPALTGSYSGNVNGDTFTVSGTTSATATSPVSATGYAIVPMVSGTNVGSYNVVPVNGVLTVTPAAITVTVAAATKTYGSANPTLTGTVTGVVNGDGIVPVYATTATATSVVGTYQITATLSDPNGKLGNYTVAITPNVLTITKATPTVSLSAPTAPVFSGTSITLTATVTAVGGAPTGVVTFYDGTVSLGTVLLNGSGVASIAVTTLPDGPQSLTAAYSGDTNYIAVTSTSSSVLVQDFGFTGPVAAQSASLGGTATFNFSLTPLNGTTFPAAITLSLNGLPIGATYAFSPASIAAGTGTTAVTLKVTLPSQLANNEAAPTNLGRKLVPFSLALLMLPLFARTRGRRSMKKMLCIAFLVIAGSAATVATTGCGSSNNSGSTTSAQQNAFNLTITAASGNLSHSTITTLSVTQ